jgi:hypothetical protein
MVRAHESDAIHELCAGYDRLRGTPIRNVTEAMCLARYSDGGPFLNQKIPGRTNSTIFLLTELHLHP